jgi:hypothetical protein
MASRPPFRTGRIPKERGEYKELTGGLGREIQAPTEEIDDEGRNSGGLFVVATLRGWVGARRGAGCWGAQARLL